MTKTRLIASALVAAVALSAFAAPAQAGIFVGVGVGAPCYRPYYYRPYWGYPYYRPYGVGVVVAAPPVVIAQPAPVVVGQPAVVVQPAPVAVQTVPATAPVTTSSPPTTVPVTTVPTTPAPPVETVSAAGGVDAHLQALSSPDERVRSDAALDLGRMRAASAVDRLAAVLANDQSAQVREAAARALGLIGSPRGLNALRYAGQADNDRDVRRSAQFAVEVITTNMRR
jgi:hypothetical protein